MLSVDERFTVVVKVLVLLYWYVLILIQAVYPRTWYAWYKILLASSSCLAFSCFSVFSFLFFPILFVFFFRFLLFSSLSFLFLFVLNFFFQLTCVCRAYDY